MKRTDWFLLVGYVVMLVLVAECSYNRGMDDMIEWYEDEEDEEVWEVAPTSNSQITRFERSGRSCSRRYVPLRFERRVCSKPA